MAWSKTAGDATLMPTRTALGGASAASQGWKLDFLAARGALCEKNLLPCLWLPSWQAMRGEVGTPCRSVPWRARPTRARRAPETCGALECLQEACCLGLCDGMESTDDGSNDA